MNAIWAIAIKDIRLLLRDRMGFFFAFIFPIMTAIFFGTIFGSGKESDGRIDIILVDEDSTEGSRSFAETLRNASELSVIDKIEEGTKGYKTTRPFSREEAETSVRTSKATAFIALPKGFGASRESLFFGGGTTIVLGVDPARRAESGMLEGVLTKYGFMQMQEAFQKPDLMRSQARISLDRIRESASLDASQKQVFEKFFGDLDQFLVDVPRQTDAAPGAAATDPTNSAGPGGPGGFQPITIERADVLKPKSPAPGGNDSAAGVRPPRNPYAWTFPQGMIWGFMGCTMSFAIALVLERTRGTLLRLRVAPLSPMHVLAGKALACFLMTQVVAIMLLLIARFAFGVVPVSIPTLAVAMVCTGAAFVGLMLFFSVLSHSERAAAGLGWGTMLIFSMIGGGMVPLFLLTGWMRALSMFSPVRWAILALEGGIWRGMSPSEMLLPCGILLAIGIAGFVAGAMVFGKAEQA
ncbi:MAG TPA: ABC transporter permease [Phycisphaerales bacterium]|nr:ABC transporter permease [Phycisphaerales bacterium]